MFLKCFTAISSKLWCKHIYVYSFSWCNTFSTSQQYNMLKTCIYYPLTQCLQYSCVKDVWSQITKPSTRQIGNSTYKLNVVDNAVLNQLNLYSTCIFILTFWCWNGLTKTKTATYMINELMNLITFDFICLSTLTNTDKLVLVYFLHV